MDYLEYNAYFTHTGDVELYTYLAPTLNFHNTQSGLRFAVSIDDKEPQIISLHQDQPEWIWNKWVAESINIKKSTHHIDAPGIHKIRFWLIDPGVVLQKLIVDTGGLKQSYLGPRESNYVTPKSTL